MSNIALACVSAIVPTDLHYYVLNPKMILALFSQTQPPPRPSWEPLPGKVSIPAGHGVARLITEVARHGTVTTVSSTALS